KMEGWGGAVLCHGTCPHIKAEIRLFTNAVAPGCEDTAADYTEATFSGYSPVVVDSGDAGCTDILEIGVDTEGIGQVVVDQQTWTEGSPATITQTITGAYVVLIDGGDEFLWMSFLFDDPAPMEAPGDILKVAGFGFVDCQMVPVA